jgi:tetratricopeptide (TPR) repeat protein
MNTFTKYLNARRQSKYSDRQFSPVFLNVWITLTLILALAGASNAAEDPYIRHVTDKELSDLILKTDVASSKQCILLGQAIASHQEPVAYAAYLTLYNKNPTGAFENLWLGEISYRLVRARMNPFSKKYYTNPLPSNFIAPVRYLEASIKLKPDLALANAYYGDYCFWDGSDSLLENHMSKGIKLLRHSLDLDPNLAIGHMYLGDALGTPYGAFYDSAAAQREYLAALQVDPLSSYIHFRLADIAIVNKDKKTAQIAIDDLPELVSSSPFLKGLLPDYRKKIASLPELVPSQIQKPVVPGQPLKSPEPLNQVATLRDGTRLSDVSLFVASYSENRILGFKIGNGGQLTPLDKESVPSGNHTKGLVADPSRALAYAVSPSTRTIWQYRIVKDELVGLKPAFITLNGTPICLFIGNFSHDLYVLLKNSNNYSVCKYSHSESDGLKSPTVVVAKCPDKSDNFILNSDETIMFVSSIENRSVTPYGLGKKDGWVEESTVILPGDEIPTSMKLHPFGRYLYVASTHNGIVQYVLNESGGLTLQEEPMLRFVIGYTQLVFDKNAEFAYAISNRGNVVTTLKVEQNGNLQEITPDFRLTDPINEQYVDPVTHSVSYIPKQTSPIALALDPYGQYLYVLNEIGTLTQYSIMSDGSLNFLSPSILQLIHVGEPSSLVISESSKH